MREKFLTLMADLDDESQKLMEDWYKELVKAGFKGDQTKDIPYHISIATFSVDKEKEVVEEMKRLASEFDLIPVSISYIGMFAGGKVLFAGPDMNPAGLLKLRESVRTETIDEYGWSPHATILLDEPEVINEALKIWVPMFHPFLAKVTKLHLCEFWPTREIFTIEL